MLEFILRVISTSAATAILLAIVGFLLKTVIIERIKSEIKHEFDTEIKKIDDELRRKTEIELSKLNNRLSMELELAKIKLGPYSESQFNIYNELWKSLCHLKYSMLELWGEASKSHLNSFSKQLFDSNMKLENSALVIEENHYIELMKILNEFANYELGKKILIEYRKQRVPSPERDQIQQMINENREIKNRLLEILQSIRRSLKRQISGQHNAEQLL
ncbi:MAG: hypothetical protein ABIA17_03105 [Elusimicrobiota bacterium]